MADATVARDATSGEEHGSGHSPALHHQFEDLAQQHEADEMGMWLFLATEILFFGGLFLAYSLYRLQDEAAFAAASHHMDLWWGAGNTAVLLCSSLSMALAVHAAQSSDRRLLELMLGATMILGTVFLCIKAYEYHHKYVEHLMPLFGLPFEYDGPSPEHAQMFFGLYFVMTGVHALHMIIGLGVLIWLFVHARRGGLLGDFSAPVHITGLYWHFVDIVWVFLFPFLYLIGAHE
jgi:cytochrome c oxidase subunit 3